MLFLPGQDELRDVLIRVPRPLRSVGADEVMDLTSRSGPLGERRTTAEFDVVGMGGDGKGPRRRFKVERRPFGRNGSRRSGRQRNGGQVVGQVDIP